uniref:Pro-opiomelanocortin/corticotropin ACTH central region domain-containing protein n=1 Tax=Gadus morhua TaxID=8049 RepID=A0A8C5FPD4_GADMO
MFVSNPFPSPRPGRTMQASWLMVVLAACACCPAARALCWQSSFCSDLRTKDRLIDCLSLCASRKASASSSPPENENSLLLDRLLSSLGDPQDHPPLGPSARGRSEDRRSYAMEHFRWGKPARRKRRPVKVQATLGEEVGGDVSAERPPPAGGVVVVRVGDEEAGGGKEVVLDVRDLEEQLMPGVTFSPETLSQEVKDPGTYRMSHFRWGSPPKRGDGQLTPKKPFILKSLKNQRWRQTHTLFIMIT